MPFYSLLNPVNDESFTSWITRCELKLSPRRFSSKKINANYYSNLDRFPILDPDFSVETLASTTVSDTLMVDPQTVLHYFRSRSTWIIPFSIWQNACTDCLMDSLKKQRCYVFLKSWRYVARPICPIHRCLLMTLPHRQRENVRAFPGKYISTNKCSLDSQQMKKLVLLALKIQRYICRLENNTNYGAPKMIAAYRFIMELFLSSGECRGLACFLYSKPTTERGALRYSGARVLMLLGPFSSSAFERMCALILTGYVIGSFSQLENHIFEVISNEHSPLHLCTTFEIGKLSNVFAEKESPTILRRLEGLYPIFSSQSYLDFVKGFKDA